MDRRRMHLKPEHRSYRIVAIGTDKNVHSATVMNRSWQQGSSGGTSFLKRAEIGLQVIEGVRDAPIRSVEGVCLQSG